MDSLVRCMSYTYTHYTCTRCIYTRYTYTCCIYTRYTYTHYTYICYIYTRYTYTCYIYTHYTYTHYTYTRYTYSCAFKYLQGRYDFNSARHKAHARKFIFNESKVVVYVCRYTSKSLQKIFLTRHALIPFLEILSSEVGLT